MSNKIYDIPGKDDNREYDYSQNQSQVRGEYEYIVKFVSESSKIIDLGCGNGSLLEKLIKEKNVTGEGIEISDSGVEVCEAKGLKVYKGRIDEKLPFPDNTFDYSICNVTIQMVMYPEVLLSEMKRISKYQIISFPNFAHFKNRLDMLLNGRMPKPMLFEYKWYSTGHIHQLSIRDFYELINDVGGIKVISKEYIISPKPFKRLISAAFPNLFVPICIFMLGKLNVLKD